MGLVYWYYLCKLMIFDREYMFGKICFFEIRKESLLNIAFRLFIIFYLQFLTGCVMIIKSLK